jgi:hypothetical protein
MSTALGLAACTPEPEPAALDDAAAATDHAARSFANKCVEVTLDWLDVTPRGLTVQTVCSYTGVEDDE